MDNAEEIRMGSDSRAKLGQLRALMRKSDAADRLI